MPDEYKPQDPGTERDDALLRNVFTNVGKRKDPPVSKLDHWEAVFRAELGHKIHARKQRRIYLGAGGAVVLMLVGLVQFIVPQSAIAPVVARVVVDKNDNKLISDRQVMPVYTGLEIKVGDALLTGSHGYLTLAYRGADIRLKTDTSLRFHATKLELLEGTVYIDTHHESTLNPGSVVVSTNYGAFTHIGTQFLVETNKDGVLAAVREGTIIGPDNTSLNAKQGPQQMRVGASGVIQTDPIDPNGGVWDWVAEAAPPLENTSANVDDVLRWATRELGLELRYKNPDVEIHARKTSLPAVGLTVERVVGAVERTTSIKIEKTQAHWFVDLAQSDPVD